MSDSGSESISSEGYDEDKNRVTTTDNVTSSRFSHHSSGSGRKSMASSISSEGKYPGSILSDHESPRSPPLSPKSQGSGLSASDIGSPRSIRSLSKSPPLSPKSYHSGNNSVDSDCTTIPRSGHSLSRSPIQNNESCLSPPEDTKSLHFEDVEVDAQRSGDNSTKSYSYKNSESRQSSPKSPSSVKSPISGQSSLKSFKSGPASPMDDQDISDKHRLGHLSPESPPEIKNDSFKELDGEQISDGDIEDDPVPISKSKPTPMTHGEDLSDVSDLESIDAAEESVEQATEIDKDQEQNDKQVTNNEESKDKEDKIAPVGLTEENEQLDFEADGQWKDERDEGKFLQIKNFRLGLCNYINIQIYY